MYEAPVKDLNFVIKNLINLDELNKISDYQHFSDDLVDAILEEAGKIGSEVLDPCNLSGDHEGSKRLDSGEVKTPKGYKEAYESLRDGGWFGLEAKEQYGGQQIPVTLSAAVNEIWHSSNMSLALCHLLTQGLIYALQKSASDDQKNFYVPKLASGEWTGTMNLTEPQAGTDLSSIKTKAVKENGHYKISGQKIYITYGEHDLSENIIHLVLARTPDAPEGNKGISVFIVPKFIPNEDGSLGDKNDVSCLSIEKKLGVKGSPTAVLQFGDNGGAIGYLVGEENQGLNIMFEMMNHARFSVGVQGLAVSERAYQQSKMYAFDRVQGIPIDGNKGDPIIDHPDVLRLASTMKSEVEAMRALAIYGGFALDMTKSSQNEYWETKSSLMIPIIKGWLTERSLEITSNAIQIHGGMGFIEETGIAQHYRDARILPIYEGTTAIQANDLVFRKTLRDNGKAITELVEEINSEISEIANTGNETLKDLCEKMTQSIKTSKKVIDHIVSISNNKKRPAVSGVNYLMMLGYVFGGWMMIKSASKSLELKNTGEIDEDFLNSKITTSSIYLTSILPKIESLSSIILKGDEDLLSMKRSWL